MTAQSTMAELGQTMQPATKLPVRIQVNMKSQARMFTLKPFQLERKAKKAAIKSSKNLSRRISPAKESLPLSTQALLASYNTSGAATTILDHDRTALHFCDDLAEQLQVFEHADNTLTFAKTPGLPLDKPVSTLDSDGSARE